MLLIATKSSTSANTKSAWDVSSIRDAARSNFRFTLKDSSLLSWIFVFDSTTSSGIITYVQDCCSHERCLSRTPSVHLSMGILKQLGKYARGLTNRVSHLLNLKYRFLTLGKMARVYPMSTGREDIGIWNCQTVSEAVNMRRACYPLLIQLVRRTDTLSISQLSALKNVGISSSIFIEIWRLYPAVWERSVSISEFEQQSW